MSTAREPLKLSNEDLYAPRVEAFLDEQAFLKQRAMPEDVEPRPFLIRLFYSSWFYLSIASGLGGSMAWAILEPFITDGGADNEVNPIAFFVFAIVSSFVGLFLGLAEGLMCRNLGRALLCGAVGLAVGFGGGLVATFGAGMIFGTMQLVVARMVEGPIDPNKPFFPTGLPLLVLMMGRAAAWAIAAIPAGIGQGIALRDRKVALNGMLGGVLGGLVGGLLFDPISYLFTDLNDPNVEADLSRAVGFTVIGLFVGLFVGLVEQWTKSAWLLMKAGPLAGKQFIVHRNPTALGSSPKADIYLFKDDGIEPTHALIHDRGGRYEIEDQNTADGTYVNGIPVTRKMLAQGDQIVLGKTVLEFALRERD